MQYEIVLFMVGDLFAQLNHNVNSFFCMLTQHVVSTELYVYESEMVQTNTAPHLYGIYAIIYTAYAHTSVNYYIFQDCVL